MITITTTPHKLTITGHAGHAEHGQDIVCAAVSALALTLIHSIEQLTEDKIEYEIESGNISVKHGNLSEKARTLTDSFFIGCIRIYSGMRLRAQYRPARFRAGTRGRWRLRSQRYSAQSGVTPSGFSGRS